MKIFSEQTLQFAKTAEQDLKRILKDEVGLECRRTRFIWKGYTYPIHVVIFESTSQWGWFDPHTYQIGLNYKLQQVDRKTVLDILRHELAHYLCFLKYADAITPHGVRFKEMCESYGWDQCVAKASLQLDHTQFKQPHDSNTKIIKRIQSLLKLAQSENPHEAQLATLKANQLIIKHSLEHFTEETWSLYAQTVLSAKRKNAKISAVYDILKHFIVSPIFIYGKGEVRLEVSGSKDNVELASYVASFLDQELERLWIAQTELKGAKAKNAFFLGIAKGYDEKVNQKLNEVENKALIKLNHQLQLNVKKAYRNLSYTSSSQSRDEEAYGVGKEQGLNLTINKGIKNKTKNKWLTWRST